MDSARAGREASNNSHRSLGRHSSTFLNSGCIRRMMRGVSSRDSPFSRRFSSPFSLPLSPEGLLLFPGDPCVAPVCEDAIILHSSYRRYLTRFLPPRVITKRFELTIEYFSNQPLDYSILIVPLRLEDFNFNFNSLRNFSCLEIINLLPLLFENSLRFLPFPFFSFLFFQGEKGGGRVAASWRFEISKRLPRRRESCCHSPLAPLFPIMLGSLFLEQKTILRGAYLCRELRLERASQIL